MTALCARGSSTFAATAGADLRGGVGARRVFGRGRLIYFVDQDGESTAQSYSGKDLTDKPAIVLMDSGSASASEIFAGGVLGTGGGIVIGTRSYGKGVAQVLYDESNCPYLHGDAVKVTAYRFYCAGGNTTDRIAWCRRSISRRISRCGGAPAERREDERQRVSPPGAERLRLLHRHSRGEGELFRRA